LSTFCASPAVMAACFGPRTRAVLAVHLFGKAVRMPELVALARERGIAVIEDLAQAVGGELEGARIGSFGDFSILSFDDRKILPGRGGALLSRNSADALRAADYQSSMEDPPSLEEQQRLSAEFNAFCRGIYTELRAGGLSRAVHGIAWDRPEALRSLYLARPRLDDVLSSTRLEAYRNLPRQRRERRRRYQAYAMRLGSKIVRFEEGEMCWRLPLLASSHEQQVELTTRIRGMGALASDHYFPASFLFGDASAPNAREIGLRAVNVWVDDQTDESLIPKVCTEIARDHRSSNIPVGQAV
jgi:dTDP-4-amino-4,6-dideoxygalactose transaminase